MVISVSFLLLPIVSFQTLLQYSLDAQSGILSA